MRDVLALSFDGRLLVLVLAFGVALMEQLHASALGNGCQTAFP
jgi:hypothetical protein